MKRVFIATIVGTIIYFAWQSVMWVGGFHQDFYTYTTKQDTIVQFLSQQLQEDGLYVMPAGDPAHMPTAAEEKVMKEKNTGKPWAMIFYHKSMASMDPAYILFGFLYTLLACLLASLVLYYGRFDSFGARFLVSMAFALFTLSQGVMDDMNWWNFPWKFIKPQFIDLTAGWAVCSVWLAWYIRPKSHANKN